MTSSSLVYSLFRGLRLEYILGNILKRLLHFRENCEYMCERRVVGTVQLG